VNRDRVTVVCATRNARPAVRLTFASFFRHNPDRWRVFVADNGSTDGTVSDLQAWPGIQVVSLAQRTALQRRQREIDRQAVARLRRDNRATAGLLSAGLDSTWLDGDEMAEHGATLDWLVGRVTTPDVLVMDSDGEFRSGGFLDKALALAERERLDALGTYEPGHLGYRPRLAPHLLLLRTDAIRAVDVSFRGGSVTVDPEEAQRWQVHSRRFELDPVDIQLFPTTRIYPTGGYLFEKLVARGYRWADLPSDLAAGYHHFGRLSWGDLADSDGGSAAARHDHARQLTNVMAALAAHDVSGRSEG